MTRLLLPAGLALTTLLTAGAAGQVQLFDSNGDAFDNWGGSTGQQFIADGSGVALDGDVLAVGGFDDAVTILRFDGSAWVEEQELDRAGDPLGQGFGTALALEGDVLAVGSFAADVGTQIDEGSVTVYRHDGTSWVEEQTLTHPTGQSGDFFGSSLALHDDLLVVGAPYDTTGGVFSVGTAQVFRFDGALWNHEQELLKVSGALQDLFGFSVAVHDDVIAVGAPLDDVGPNVDQGSIQVYREGALGWDLEDEVFHLAGQSIDYLGWSLELLDDRLFASEPFADQGRGGVRVYEWNGLDWLEQQHLQAAAAQVGELFGLALDLDGEVLAVGAPHRSFGLVFQQGAALVFEHDGSQFVEVLDQTPADGEAGHFYGTSVATHLGRLASSAPGKDVVIDQDIGCVWVDTFEQPWSDEGCALAGVSGDPALTGSGTLAEGSNNLVTLSNAAPGALTGLFLALASNPVPFKGGTLKPIPFLLPPILFPTDAGGGWAVPFVMPAAVPAGTELWVQVAIQDGAAVAGFSLSNALRGLTP